jgi:hypothetical protein
MTQNIDQAGSWDPRVGRILGSIALGLACTVGAVAFVISSWGVKVRMHEASQAALADEHRASGLFLYGFAATSTDTTGSARIDLARRFDEIAKRTPDGSGQSWITQTLDSDGDGGHVSSRGVVLAGEDGLRDLRKAHEELGYTGFASSAAVFPSGEPKHDRPLWIAR